MQPPSLLDRHLNRLAEAPRRSGPDGLGGRPDASRVAGAIHYGWACCVFNQVHFVYVYGLRADCARVFKLHHGTTLHKGDTATLEKAQSDAEAAADHLQAIYDGIGSARAVPVRVFLRNSYGLDLDDMERMSLRA